MKCEWYINKHSLRTHGISFVCLCCRLHSHDMPSNVTRCRGVLIPDVWIYMEILLLLNTLNTILCLPCHEHCIAVKEDPPKAVSTGAWLQIPYRHTVDVNMAVFRSTYPTTSWRVTVSISNIPQTCQVTTRIARRVRKDTNAAKTTSL